MSKRAKRKAKEITMSSAGSQSIQFYNKEGNMCENTSLDDLRAQNSELCSRCNGIDMDNALKVTNDQSSRFIMPLGNISEDMKYSLCPLCRLFSFTFVPLETKRYPTLRGHHLRVFMVDSTDINTINFRGHGVALGVCQGILEKKIAAKERLRCLAKGFIAPVFPRNPHPSALQLQLVSRGKVDFQQMQAWLQKCQDNHSGICGRKTGSRPIGFKCIDINTRLTCYIKSDDEYYALSYVWATSNTGTSAKGVTDDASALPLSGVPQVIEDAIAVVRGLGGQYLWVDKYCINQKDQDQKQTQINAMDKIYEGAIATIIAASAKNSPPGLAGVSRPRILQQPTELVGSHLLASTLSHISKAVAASTWVTRGWTYQEAVLSERCFFFTDEQVHFLCRCSTSCESIAASPKAVISSPIRARTRNDAWSVNETAAGQNLTGLWDFFDTLHHYKSRDLTYESDSLNAFQGLLAKSSFRNIWGVPIACDPDREEAALSIGFARGLWWENPGNNWSDVLKAEETYVSYTRRPSFPSWSWAGWGGPTRPHKYCGDKSSDTGCNEVDDESFDIQFWVELTSGEQISLSEFCHLTKKSSQVPQLSHILHIETEIHKVRIRRHPHHPKSMACICDCPLDYNRCNKKKKHMTSTHNVRFFEDLMRNESFSDVIFSQFWDVIPLFTAKDSKYSVSIASLIIDWNKESSGLAQVRGVAYLHRRLFLGTRRLKFRLT
ncbi:hypothetical protein VE01_03590 [Pseudogymnoascus verrucosus]|uniref:Heterokaryon incompatibility domain-containing protein n=1 Tax=Pseudogymnoascus verrucosus TaxID=342668 RepID=A0A1B8GRU9_9PEZI|nr:uncharacterized protein VE01_03590 [Pseudogymnoascus verrucosus]OBT98557.2 hypothetical protein VE01_03590 [Pseudogymnoascus verrucosus]